MNKTSGYKVSFFIALIPLSILLFVSCSSTPKTISLDEETTKQWNTAVEKTIAEPQRATKLKALGLQLQDVASSIQKDIDVLHEKVALLNEDYDASNEELQQLVADFSKKRNAKFAKYRDIIYAMRSEVSADEWEALYD